MDAVRLKAKLKAIARRAFAPSPQSASYLPMSWTPTLILTALAVIAGGVCGWRGAQPPDPRRGPRLFPWRFVMLLCAACAFYLLTHMISLVRQ